MFLVDAGVHSAATDLPGWVTTGFDAVGDGREGDDCNGHGTAMADVIDAGWGVVPQLVVVPVVRVVGCDGTGPLSWALAGGSTGRWPGLQRLR